MADLESEGSDEGSRTIAATQALGRLFLGVDPRDYDLAVDAFTPSGTWLRQGKTLEGHADIRAALYPRRLGQTTVHVVTNVLLADAGVARFYLTVHRQSSADGENDAPATTMVGFGRCRLQERRLAELVTGPYPIVREG